MIFPSMPFLSIFPQIRPSFSFSLPHSPNHTSFSASSSLVSLLSICPLNFEHALFLIIGWCQALQKWHLYILSKFFICSCGGGYSHIRRRRCGLRTSSPLSNSTTQMKNLMGWDRRASTLIRHSSAIKQQRMQLLVGLLAPAEKGIFVDMETSTKNMEKMRRRREGEAV